jgi:hypothetical protein
MAYRFFQVPVRNSGAAEEELNRFLRGHRVLSVDRRWVDLGTESYWSFCVDDLEAPAAPLRMPGDQRGKVDYREVLNPEPFAAFVKLRALGQAISKEDAVPVCYTDKEISRKVLLSGRYRAGVMRRPGMGQDIRRIPTRRASEGRILGRPPRHRRSPRWRFGLV